MYDAVKRMQELYVRLQDEQSKDIFWSRLAFDLEPSMTNMMKLCTCGNQTTLEHQKTWKATYLGLNQAGEKIVIYGAGFVGRDIAAALQYEQIDFWAFCDREYARYPDGVLGKPVISPDELLKHPDQYYVVNATSIFYYAEIERLLREHQYPEKRILRFFGVPRSENQYFDFPSLYQRGTAFVDCGCFDCGDSYTFIQWCEGQYSSIFAFEPDPANIESCKARLEKQPIRDFHLIPMGVSDSQKTVVFGSNGGVTSHILCEDLTDSCNGGDVERFTLRTTTIDKTVANQTVGFIKMDIEGSELDALHGAEETISRDKPLLAICVYHKQGDILAIMDYLQHLVPEYRFWIRHYGPASAETVLYAAL